MADSETTARQRFRDLGWSGRALDEVGGLVSAAAQLGEELEAVAANPLKSLEDTLRLLASLGNVVEGIRKLTSAPGLPDQLKNMGPEFVESLLVEYLHNWHPVIYHLFELLTLIEPPVPSAELPVVVRGSDGTTILRVAVPQPRLHLERLPTLLGDPVKTLGDYYFPRGLQDGAAADVAADRLFPRIAELVNQLSRLKAHYGLPSDTLKTLDWGAAGNALLAHMLCIYTPPGSFLHADETDITDYQFGTTLALVSPDRNDGHDAGVAFGPFGKFDVSVPFGAGWSMQAALGASLPPFLVGPRGFAFLESAGGASLSGKLVIQKGAHDEQPAWLFGSATGTRFEVASTSLAVTLDLKDGTSEFGFLINVEGAALYITPGDGDGFLQKVLPREGFRIDVRLALGWSNVNGLYFDGGAGFEVTLPVHRSLLGVIDVDTISLALAVGKDALKLGLGTSVGLKLGPLAVSVEKMGLAASLAFRQGNLGPADLAFNFKPPTGIGVVIDAGPVTGGGFISFDFDNQRYAGVLQLKLYSIGITAIGLLDTRLPGGQTGFSFLIIITVDFTPVQIGFGFTLNGVGGLIGINRTMMTQVLRDGLRTQALDNILFPREPVKRATQLISDLRRIYPPAEGRYVFGPMLKIGWATFVEATLGVILEVPSPVRIVILGQLTVMMPRPEAPIIEFHLDVLGVIDFGEQLFTLDASLYNSRVVIFNVSGDMAMRLSWGEQPSFALSFGGLNPHFQPPPNFPTLRRLSISLGAEDNPRLSLESYFAITSNSFQFGAALSLYAHLGALSVRGYFGFDALFIFKPFSFIIDFEAHLEVKLWSLTLLGIHLKATLSGPTPWHIVGEASVSILFFSISVHVDFTFGDERHEALPGADPWDALRPAVQDQRNWTAALPSATVSGVTLAAAEGANAPLLIDPVGGVTFRQKVVPLNQRITKFGEAPPVNHFEFNLNPINLEGAEYGLVTDHFVPGQFREMSDAEKISSPSFVEMYAGFTLASGAVKVGGGLAAKVEYQTSVIDHAAVQPGAAYSMKTEQMLLVAERATPAAAQGAGLSKFARRPGQPPLVALDGENFVVVRNADGHVREDITEPVPKGRAQMALADYLSTHPHEADTLQVVPTSDLEVTP